jgi:CBS domain-containing membrane protein
MAAEQRRVPTERRGASELVESEHAGDLHEVLGGLAARARLRRLEARHGRRAVLGAFALCNGLVSIAIVSAVAWATRQPFVFPSLGPTAFLFFYRPLHPSSSPRNTISGHAIGAAVGFACLAVFGLEHARPAMQGGVTPARIGSAAVSLALTAGLMVWLAVPHPPAGATTLIVSLGILHSPQQLGVLMAGVVLLAAQGFVINRLAGLDYPLWRGPPRPRRDPPSAAPDP